MALTPGSLSRRADLYFQLGNLLTAGVPVLQALDAVQRSCSGANSRHLGALRAQIQAGSTLGGALQQRGRWVPDLDLALLDAGEQSGRLDRTFRALADHYRERALLARKLLSSLAYPVFVLHFAILIFPTSYLTGLLVAGGLEAFVLHKVMILGPCYGGLIFLWVLTQGPRADRWRALLERVGRGIPILGGARWALALSNFSAALEALLSAGVPIIRAWGIAGRASGSKRLDGITRAAVPMMESGATPSEMIRRSGAFPEMFQSLYASGELSGQLDSTLARLSAHYREEASHKFQALAEWTPKLIFLLVAIGIGYQVISFYTGYFDQINKIGF